MMLSTCVVLVGTASLVRAQDWRWEFTQRFADEGFAVIPDTPTLGFQSECVYAPPEGDGAMLFDGRSTVVEIARERADGASMLPAREFTVGAWVSIDMPKRWGGIIGCVQDNGDEEKGWVLGYNEQAFTLGLATEGADDGDGFMTYVATSTPYQIGHWYHVVATYDGARVRMYINGEPAGESSEQHGAILYDDEAPFVIGAYRDANEDFPHDGRVLEVRLLDRVLKPAEIRTWYDERASLTPSKPWFDTALDWLVAPYLTWPTESAMSVMCETTIPTLAMVRYWHETASASSAASMQSSDRKMLHEFRLTNLQPNAKYFYQMSVVDHEENDLAGEVLSFRTAARPDEPFTFIAIGDTQSQPEVVKRVSDLAYMHRPNLVVHAGDLVTTGTDKQHWTGHFFPNMQPLIGRVPLMPVLGNHEQDAPHYYKYMSLPEPESYYTFTFGNAEFFMIDGNRTLNEGSEQLTWLDNALAASKATWKFAVLHQPPYTSDSNDYGDTFETTSNRGDPNVRNIIRLLEKYHVDICFSGHVHDYERTFPILGTSVTEYEDGGVIYVTTAGGGGHLEDFDPTNTWFGHKKARYHHLVYVGVNGGHLEFQAIDEHGRLFDVFELRKSSETRSRTGTATHSHP